MEWLCSVLSRQLLTGADHCDRFLSEYDHWLLVSRLLALPASIQIVKPVCSDEDMSSRASKASNFVSELGVRAQSVPIEWGPSISHCLSCHWRCVLCVCGFVYGEAHGRIGLVSPIKEASTRREGMASLSVQEFSRLCLDQLDVAGEEVTIPLRCLAILVPKVRLCD